MTKFLDRWDVFWLGSVLGIYVERARPWVQWTVAGIVLFWMVVSVVRIVYYWVRIVRPRRLVFRPTIIDEGMFVVCKACGGRVIPLPGQDSVWGMDTTRRGACQDCGRPYRVEIVFFSPFKFFMVLLPGKLSLESVRGAVWVWRRRVSIAVVTTVESVCRRVAERAWWWRTSRGGQ